MNKKKIQKKAQESKRSSLSLSIVIFRFLWKHREQVSRLTEYEAEKVTLTLWRDSKKIIFRTLASLACLIGVAELIQRFSSHATPVLLLPAFMLLIWNTWALLCFLILPADTSAESKQFRLLWRRVRRATSRVVASAEEHFGVSPERASGLQIVNLVMTGRLGQTFIDEIVTRLDLLMISGRLACFLGSFAFFFSVVYWVLPDSARYNGALFYSLGILSTAGSTSLGPNPSTAAQAAAFLQETAQIILVVIMLPLLLNLYDRNKAMNQRIADKLPEEGRKVRTLARDHEARFPHTPLGPASVEE